MFLRNLEAKMNDSEFITDTEAILRLGETYNPADAFVLIKTELIEGM